MGTVERRTARELFAKRFSAVLDETDAVPRTRGRRTWVAKKWAVSVETARKWLTGLDIPDRAHLAAICTDLRVSPDYMLTGLGPRYLMNDDALLDRLVGAWSLLDVDQRKQVVDFAAFMAQRAPPEDVPMRPTERNPLPLRR